MLKKVISCPNCGKRFRITQQQYDKMASGALYFCCDQCEAEYYAKNNKKDELPAPPEEVIIDTGEEENSYDIDLEDWSDINRDF